MKTCSALRVIPDALPAYRNEEALLSSLNKILLDSNIIPDNLAPSGTQGDVAAVNGLNSFSITLSADEGNNANVGVVATFLGNVDLFANLISKRLHLDGTKAMSFHSPRMPMSIS